LVFQSTRPRGARHGRASHPSSGDPMFQSTRPRGARRAWPIESTTRRVSFNPRARVGRDRPQRRKQMQRHRFQSTRPRGARLLAVRLPVPPRLVSIHAPAWGATMWQGSRTVGPTGFNPRARVGRDSGSGCPGRCSPRCFNPRARVGRDTRDGCMGLSTAQFQSTRPRGARPIGRHRVGVDDPVSIHAPAWGATAPRCCGWCRCRCFNPRARVGRDDRGGRLRPVRAVSIHAPAWGATQGNGKTLNTIKVSIHAPAWGATGGVQDYRSG